MEHIRVGIIGMGNMGSAHAKCILEGSIAGMALAAVCDIDTEKLKAFSSAKAFDNADTLINSGEVDAVIIATPHYSHPAIAVSAFKAGLHVLCEKPVGVYTAQVNEMNAEAEKSGRVFAVMFNQRTNPLFVKARDIVKSGALGKKKRLVWIVTNWYRTQSYYSSGGWRATWSGEGGGVLLNQAPHNLDIWQWIFGMPSKITAFCTEGKYHNIEVEDDAAIYAEYEDGSTAVFITSTGEYPGTNRLEISGDLGKIVLEDNSLKHYKLSAPEREFCFSEKGYYPEYDVSLETYCGDEKISGHTAVLQNFCDAVLKGEPLISPGCEGINSLTISNAAYLSSWKGEPVGIPLDEKEFESKLNEKAARSLRTAEKIAEKPPLSGYSCRWEVNW